MVMAFKGKGPGFVTGMRRAVRDMIFFAIVSCLMAWSTPVSAGQSWPPRIERAAEYAEERQGSISFAVVGEQGKMYGYRRRRVVPAASVIKAMFLVAYLRQPSVRDRALRDGDRALLGPMIRRSDNTAATRVADQVGAERMRRLGRIARMHRFTYTRPWGLSGITAADQARFLFRLERYIPRRHEDYARYLLSHIVERQRWGIGRVDLGRWKLFFKGGWGSGTGRVDHQVAFLQQRDGRRIAVAIMTEYSPSHAYGKRTLRGVARRLLRNLR